MSDILLGIGIGIFVCIGILTPIVAAQVYLDRKRYK